MIFSWGCGLWFSLAPLWPEVMHTEDRVAARRMDLVLVQMIKKMMAQSRQCAAARTGSPISRDGVILCVTSFFYFV